MIRHSFRRKENDNLAATQERETQHIGHFKRTETEAFFNVKNKVCTEVDGRGTGPECNFSHIAFLTALTLAGL